MVQLLEKPNITSNITVIKKDSWIPDPVNKMIQEYNPRSDFGKYVKTCLHYLPNEMAVELIERITSLVIVESALYGTVFYGCGGIPWNRLVLSKQRTEYLGLLGRRVVTDVGVADIVDAFQNSQELEDLKYHALGTGSTAEAAGDTALITELTTEYTGNVRATGTTTEHAANIYKTIATNTLDGTPGSALREHGVFDQAATGGGTLLDRTVFAAITLSSGDGLQTDYRLTFTSGS